MESKNIKYLVLTIALLILSAFGVFLIFKIKSSSIPVQIIDQIVTTPTEIILPTVTPIIEITPEATPSPSKIASPTPTKKITKITPTPSATPTAKLTITPTIKITPTPSAIPTAIPTITSSNSSPTILTFKKTEDSFSIDYLSSRKLYQDIETSGNRYTFYSLSGNFAVHVSPSGSWAWTNSDRNFSPGFTVSGQNTFRYDIATQTIVDLQSSDKNYTIQCVHNGKESLKTECEAFIQSFQFL